MFRRDSGDLHRGVVGSGRVTAAQGIVAERIGEAAPRHGGGQHGRAVGQPAVRRRAVRVGVGRHQARAVQADGGGGRNSPPNAKTIATYSHDRVVPGIPPAASGEEDKRLLREVARKVVTDAVRNGSVTA